VIEASIVKRQGERIGHPIVDAIGKPATARQLAGGLDVFPRQIDPGHAAAERAGQIARRTADPAAEVEDVHVGSQAGALGMFAGRGDAAAVQLVERPEVLVAGLAGVDPGFHERRKDAIKRVPATVVVLDPRCDIGHFCLRTTAVEKPIV
jgi:hypothetical protein